MSKPDKYDEWAQRWATGVRAAEAFTAQRRTAQKARAIHNRAEGAKHPCGIKGCKRHSYKGRLCRFHYAMVPHEDKMRLVMACWDAQFKVTSRHRARFLRELQARLNAAPSIVPASSSRKAMTGQSGESTAQRRR